MIVSASIVSFVVVVVMFILKDRHCIIIRDKVKHAMYTRTNSVIKHTDTNVNPLRPKRHDDIANTTLSRMKPGIRNRVRSRSADTCNGVINDSDKRRNEDGKRRHASLTNTYTKCHENDMRSSDRNNVNEVKKEKLINCKNKFKKNLPIHKSLMNNHRTDFTYTIEKEEMAIVNLIKDDTEAGGDCMGDVSRTRYTKGDHSTHRERQVVDLKQGEYHDVNSSLMKYGDGRDERRTFKSTNPDLRNPLDMKSEHIPNKNIINISNKDINNISNTSSDNTNYTLKMENNDTMLIMPDHVKYNRKRIGEGDMLQPVHKEHHCAIIKPTLLRNMNNQSGDVSSYEDHDELRNSIVVNRTRQGHYTSLHNLV